LKIHNWLRATEGSTLGHDGARFGVAIQPVQARRLPQRVLPN
jgi:hypothetical protein